MRRRRRVFCNWSVLGLGIYVNTVSYRYVALQLGPLWVYVYAERGLLA